MKEKIIEHIVLSESDEFIFGKTTEDGIDVRHWMQSKTNLWFLQPLNEMLSYLNLDNQRYVEIENIIDGDFDNLYWVKQLETDEAVKWFLGLLMVESKETNAPFRKIISPYALNCFANGIISNRIARPFSKEIFKEFIDALKVRTQIGDISFDDYEKYGYDDANVFVMDPFEALRRPEHILDIILSNPKYKLIDSSELDKIIDNVLEQNADQFAKLKDDPKLMNWFVGQCMKVGKGKLSPADIKQKLEERLN